MTPPASPTTEATEMCRCQLRPVQVSFTSTEPDSNGSTPIARFCLQCGCARLVHLAKGMEAKLAAARQEIEGLKAEVVRLKEELQAVTWKPQPGEDKAFGIARLTTTAIKAIRERDAARAALTEAHACISATVLGIILGKRPTPEAEAEINRVVDLINSALAPATPPG